MEDGLKKKEGSESEAEEPDKEILEKSDLDEPVVTVLSDDEKMQSLIKYI